MSALHTFFRQVGALFRRQKLEREMAEEMQFHLEQRVADNREDGLAEEEARYAARRRFGNVGVLQERARDGWGARWVEAFGRDLGLAVRQWGKAPGFTATVVFTLALGIGSVVTGFTVLNAVLFRPMPFIQHQERMLALNEAIPAGGLSSTGISLGDFLTWRQQARSLETLWIYQDRSFLLSGGTEPARIAGTRVEAGAFAAMGVRPMLGRDFRAEDDVFRAPSVVLLGHELWQARFGGDPQIVGRVVTINGEPTEIVGVMPEGWRYPETADMWVPLREDPATAAYHGLYRFNGHAMLKPGATLEEARAEFALISERLARDFPDSNKGVVATLRPMREAAAEGTARLTVLLFAVVTCVFLIACANVANLLLVRTASRTKEIALRLALGASKGRVLAQFLTETFALAVLGAGVGGLAAVWGLHALLRFIPVELPYWMRFDFDGRVFGFAAMLLAVTAALCGIVPAWQAARASVNEALKGGGRTSGGASRSHPWHQALVALEISLAVVLLTGAGLLLHSAWRLQGVEPGFDPRHVVAFRAAVPAVPGGAQFFTALQPGLVALPGVDHVAASTGALPGIGGGGSTAILREGEPEPTNFSEKRYALNRAVTLDYFTALKIAQVSGRALGVSDDSSHPRVAVVDERFAQKYFPGENPVGKRFRTEAAPGQSHQWREIVGVVGATRQNIDQDEAPPVFYVPFAQEPANFMWIVMRTHEGVAEAGYFPLVRAAMAAVNKDVPVFAYTTLEQAMAQGGTVWKRRFLGWLAGGFSAVALVLAAVGIYGVMSFTVAQRTVEIGLRMALGARPGDVWRLVLGRGVGPLAVGVAAGVAGSLAAGRALESFLFRTSTHDPVVLAVVTLLLSAVAALACVIPARRATKVDPMVALRAD